MNMTESIVTFRNFANAPKIANKNFFRFVHSLQFFPVWNIKNVVHRSVLYILLRYGHDVCFSNRYDKAL
jgi:hypothetical protein